MGWLGDWKRVGWRPWENSAPADGSGESLLFSEDSLAKDESWGWEQEAKGSFSVFTIPFVSTSLCSLGHPHVPEKGISIVPFPPILGLAGVEGEPRGKGEVEIPLKLAVVGDAMCRTETTNL